MRKPRQAPYLPWECRVLVFLYGERAYQLTDGMGVDTLTSNKRYECLKVIELKLSFGRVCNCNKVVAITDILFGKLNDFG